MTRFPLIFLFGSLSLTAVAETKVCESFEGDTIVTDYTCPAGYRKIGTVDNGERRRGARLSESTLQGWDWIKETDEQRKAREERARRLGESITNNFNEIAEAGRERAKVRERLEEIVPDLTKLIKSRSFKKWVRKSKERKKVLRELKDWDGSSLRAMLKLIPQYKSEEIKSLYDGQPSQIHEKYEYFGDMFGGNKVGRGLVVFNSGTNCYGEFLNNNITGIGGCFYTNNGNAFLGSLEKGLKSGEGASYYAESGSTYRGNYSNGKRSGEGYFSYLNGNSYKGEFKEGLREGFGVYSYARGTKYVGGWKNNKRHGSGSIIRADGWTNIVEYDNGNKHGKARYLDGDKMVMIATFDKGKCDSVKFLISQNNAGEAAKLNCREQIPVSSLR